MANGGRGWFQRRRPAPDISTPRSEDRTPEPTRIEAYEAQRRAQGGSPSAFGDEPDFDSLLRPHESSARAGAPRDESPLPARAPEDADDRRWAPPRETRMTRSPEDREPGPVARPADSGSKVHSTDDSDSRPSRPAAGPQDPVGRVDEAGHGRSAPTPAPQVPPQDASPSAPAAREPDARPVPTRFDWDAATAAALADDPAQFDPVGEQPRAHGDPDRLLEDIIREIVGEQTADTVSSLQEPASRRSESREHPAASSPTHPDVGSDVDGSSPPPPSDIAAPAVSETAAEAVPEADGTYAVEAENSRTPEFGAPPVADPAPAFHAYDAPPTSVAASAEHAVVSRETSPTDGGTPLADQLADETRRRNALDQAVLPLPTAPRVFTISNQKGGVGKTTTAVNLAAALARAGARVLVVDLDPQGNASTALGVDHRSDQQSVYEVLVSDLPIADVVRPSTEHENLHCVPATIHLAGAEIELVSLVAREQRLRRALDAHLDSMAQPYDYVFIDCPPSLGLLTINAFVAAREVLIPIQCEYYALEGLSQLLSNIDLIERHLNPELRLSTILLTMYDSRTNLAQQVAQEVREHFPAQTLDTIIPRSVRVSEAPSYGQSVITYDFTSTGSLSYREAAAEIAWRGAERGTEQQKESS